MVSTAVKSFYNPTIYQRRGGNKHWKLIKFYLSETFCAVKSLVPSSLRRKSSWNKEESLRYFAANYKLTRVHVRFIKTLH